MYIYPQKCNSVMSIGLGELINHPVNISNRTEISTGELEDDDGNKIYTVSFVEEMFDWYFSNKNDRDIEFRRINSKIIDMF